LKRSLIFLLAGLAGALALACGSDEDKIDEDRAEEIAERALLAKSHLPGRNWQETARDDFEESDDFPETDACEELNDFFEELDEGDDEPLVVTNVTYEREQSDDEPISLSIEAEIEVHEGTASDIDFQKEADRILEDAGFDECMEDFAEQAGEEIGGEGEYERRDPTAKAPEDGFAMSFAIRFILGEEEFEAVGELYIWNYKHVQSQVAFLGTEDQMDEDLIEDVLDEAADRVRAAQED